MVCCLNYWRNYWGFVERQHLLSNEVGAKTRPCFPESENWLNMHHYGQYIHGQVSFLISSHSTRQLGGFIILWKIQERFTSWICCQHSKRMGLSIVLILCLYTKSALNAFIFIIFYLFFLSQIFVFLPKICKDTIQ